MLIAKGADVNVKTHDQDYTALMFAALSNNSSIVSLLLENEADTEYQNKIGRTASQMATFVNSLESVDVIKGFIPKKLLEYYTQINSISETEAKLPKGDCFEELYKLLTSSINYSPIRILKAIKFSKSNVLLENIDKVIKTLDAFTTKSFKNTETGCPNDVLAFKLHYYKFIFEYLKTQQKKLSTASEESKKSSPEFYTKLFEVCAKPLLVEEKVTIKDPSTDEMMTKMHRVFEEKFLRELIRQFAYPECVLISQMVTILSKTSIGNYPTALKVISDCLNGQRLNEDESLGILKTCATCLDKHSDTKLCTHCRQVAYCDQVCQRLHWSIHKKEILDAK